MIFLMKVAKTGCRLGDGTGNVGGGIVIDVVSSDVSSMVSGIVG
jgi:hypothetical protein